MENTIDLQVLRDHEGVVKFINRVVSKLHTAEEAKAITEELEDHLVSLAEDYLYQGYDLDKAIAKALLQMGDPSEIGYSFTDYDLMKKRRMSLIGLKSLGLIILIGIGCYLLMLGAGSEEAVSQVAENTSLLDASILERIFMSLSNGADTYGFVVFYMVYMPLMFFMPGSAFRSGIYGLGIPLNKLAINKEPLLILWPAKKRFPWEYALVGAFFLPIIITFFALAAYEGSNIWIGMITIGLFACGIYLIIMSERFRIPKYMVLEEGIVIRNRLVSFAAIDRIMWQKEYLAKEGNHYKLILEFCYHQELAHGRNRMSNKVSVLVHERQVTELRGLMVRKVG